MFTDFRRIRIHPAFFAAGQTVGLARVLHQIAACSEVGVARHQRHWCGSENFHEFTAQYDRRPDPAGRRHRRRRRGLTTAPDGYFDADRQRRVHGATTLEWRATARNMPRTLRAGRLFLPGRAAQDDRSTVTSQAYPSASPLTVPIWPRTKLTSLASTVATIEPHGARCAPPAPPHELAAPNGSRHRRGSKPVCRLPRWLGAPSTTRRLDVTDRPGAS